MSARAPQKMPLVRRTSFLAALWAIAMLLAVLCGGVFAAGVARDTRAGEATLDLSLGTSSDWVHSRFRVWQPRPYRLFISTVNHDPARVGRSFDGELEVTIWRPDGTVLYEQQFQGRAIPHVVPDNYGDTELARLDLEPSLLRPWTVGVRVNAADPEFVGLRSQVKLWSERTDPGMGGLVNYVMIIPAGVFSVVALLLALSLARRGLRLPLLGSALTLLAILLWSAR